MTWASLVRIDGLHAYRIRGLQTPGDVEEAIWASPNAAKWVFLSALMTGLG